MNNYYLSIDIGSKYYKFLLLDENQKVIRANTYHSDGVKYGYISDNLNFQNSINFAWNNFLKHIQKNKIQEIIIGINGFGLEGEIFTTTKSVPHKIIKNEILNDLERNIDNYLSKKYYNKKILYKTTTGYFVDDFEYANIKDGMKGKNIKQNTFVMTYPKNIYNAIEDIFEQKNISVVIKSSLLWLGEYSLSVLDKKSGVLLIDLGWNQTSIIHFENNTPQNFHVFKNGNYDITKQIALKNKISLEDAEKIKTSKIKNKKNEKIIKDELKKIADLINQKLQEWGRKELLPGGIVLTGGGSKNVYSQEIFQKILNLPIKNISTNLTKDYKEYQAIFNTTQNYIEKQEYKTDSVIKNFIKNNLKKINIFNFL